MAINHFQIIFLFYWLSVCIGEYSIIKDAVDVTDLSQPRNFLVSAKTTNKVGFGFGQTLNGTISNMVDMYDADSGNWTSMMLDTPRWVLGGIGWDEKMFFAGETGNALIQTSSN